MAITDEYARGALAERKRIAAVLNHPAATGREALAKHLALGGSLTAADAIAALENAPRGETAEQINLEAGAAEARRVLGKEASARSDGPAKARTR